MVITMKAPVGKETKLLGETIPLLSKIRGETVDRCGSQNECTYKKGMTWHDILIIILYVVIILAVIILAVKLFIHVYRLCSFTNLQMPDKYIKQNY